MNSKLDGPFVSAFESETTGVVKQELITYRVKDGMLRKEITTRKFSGDGDYHDSNTVEPLIRQEAPHA
jgi:hypothetical protein|tara:strand:+ start:892 stop:1095 length:204 start_codon:yes stop_codon:yes gene_type:complete